MTLVVWSYSEVGAAASELAGAADQIASAAGGSSQVLEVDTVRQSVASRGKLLLKSAAPLGGSADLVAEAIFRAAKALSPSVILIAPTRTGRELAGRLAAKMRVGLLDEVAKLALTESGLRGERSVYAGRLSATVASPLPCVATVKPGAYGPIPQGEGPVQVFEAGAIAQRTKVVSRSAKQAGGVDLKSAKVIVAAGRGFKAKADLGMADQLALALDGAVGCSRPISSDLGWLSEEHHIGLTGVSVHPDLYLAVGISGQLQHVAGIKDSKVIVAINSDKSAPIFQASDYGVAGDLYQVVPALLKLLSERKS